MLMWCRLLFFLKKRMFTELKWCLLEWKIQENFKQIGQTESYVTHVRLWYFVRFEVIVWQLIKNHTKWIISLVNSLPSYLLNWLEFSISYDFNRVFSQKSSYALLLFHNHASLA